MTDPTWNATFLRGDVVEEVRTLVERGAKLLVYGSGRLAETLRAADLVRA